MIVYSPNSSCCAVCDYVAVLALVAVYVNSLNRTIAYGAITHETTPLELCIDKHTEKIVLNIISTPHHPIILGLL